MDMTTRSFVLAAALALFAAAGVIAWSLFGSGLGAVLGPERGDSRDARGSGGSITITHGSMRDEFGEADDIGLGGGPGFDSGARFEAPARFDTRPGFADSAAPRPGGGPRFADAAPARFGAGPRFDWSGQSDDAAVYDLPRETPEERVEADCRVRGASSYGCRCLVRLARRDLSEAEFAFLSLAEDPSPRAERLQSSGLAARDLPALAARLVALDVDSRRRCGAGLSY